MTSYQQTFLDYLKADSTLTMLLTGGIYDSSLLPREGLTPTNTAGIYAADGLTVLPFMAITWGESNAAEDAFAADVQFVELYLHQDRGYDTINGAAARVRALFRPSHRFHDMDDATSMFVQYVNTSAELVSEDLIFKPMKILRLRAGITLI